MKKQYLLKNYFILHLVMQNYIIIHLITNDALNYSVLKILLLKQVTKLKDKLVIILVSQTVKSILMSLIENMLS